MMNYVRFAVLPTVTMKVDFLREKGCPEIGDSTLPSHKSSHPTRKHSSE